MKKKIFMFGILLFILTGCNVNYKLEIDDKLNENMLVFFNSEDRSSSVFDSIKYIPVDNSVDDYQAFENKIDGIEYYEIKKEKDNIKVNYNHNIDNYNNSSLPLTCYEYVTATKNDNKLILATSKEFSCFEKYNQLEDVIVTITSKYKLTDTNADNIEKHKYIWYINKDNANNKRLYLSLDTSIEELTFLEKLMRGDYFTPFTISIMLLIIGSIIYLILKRKSNKVDAI